MRNKLYTGSCERNTRLNISAKQLPSISNNCCYICV